MGMCGKPGPCKTLGYALSIAKNNETIILEPGTYKAATDPVGKPNVVTFTSVVIKDTTTSGNATNTIITGAGTTYGLTINATGVKVLNVTVTKSRRSGILVAPPGTPSFTPPATPASIYGVTITHVVVTGNDTCAFTATVKAHTVTGCKTPTPFSDFEEGVHLMSAKESTVSHSKISGNWGGLLVTDELGPNSTNTIVANTISTNAGDCGVTLAGHNAGAVYTSGPTIGKPNPAEGGVFTNLIETNTANNDGAAGLLAAGGPPGTGVYHNTYTGNHVQGNGLAGMTIHSHAPLQDMNGNIVTHNTFSHNALHGANGNPGDYEGPPSSANMEQSANVQVLGAIYPVTGTVVSTNTMSTTFYGVWMSPHELAASTVSGNTISVSAGGTAVYSEPTADAGYLMAGTDGGVFGFGNLGYYGSVPGNGVAISNAVGMVESPDGGGYWVATATGKVYAFGDATSYGTLPALHVTVSNIVGIAGTSDGGGYWLVGSDGGVFAFGDAGYAGSVPSVGVHVNNVVGIAAGTTTGYWLVGSDGGVYAFGTAPFKGSVPGVHVSVNNVVAIAAMPLTLRTQSKVGYWVVGSDGGVYAFGTAPFEGSVPGVGAHVNNVRGLAPAATGHGYWVVGSDGGVFGFAASQYQGSLPGLGIRTSSVIGIVSNPGVILPS